MTQPNILILMADQLAPHFTGAYGHPVAQTPNIDGIAARGMRFDAAYCNSPLCAPSRASMMSGRLPPEIAAYDNASELPAGVPTFAHHLGALGYRTCLAGRMHFVGPDQTHGFHERLNTDVYPGDFAWVPDWENNDTRIDSWYHNMDPVIEAGPATATFQTDYDDEVDFAACRWLIDRGRDRASGDQRPFFLVASFMHPHDPYVPKPEFWDLYDGVDIPPPAHPKDAKSLSGLSRRVADGIGATTAPVEDHHVAAARRGYLANASYFDDKVGRILTALDDIGETENTIVIVIADHGDMLGERGLWYKMTFYEQSARVPLIMAGPGVQTGAVGNVCSLVDLLPTLVEAGGGDAAAIRPDVDGRSLMPLARGEAASEDEAIGVYCAEMAGAPVVMIRRGDLKYISCPLDPPELYDVAQDPHELTNLADDPAYGGICAAFEAEISGRWDLDAMHHDVIDSQHARRAVHAGLMSGGGYSWDYTPPRDGATEYVRNNMDWTTAAARLRFPPYNSG